MNNRDSAGKRVPVRIAVGPKVTWVEVFASKPDISVVPVAILTSRPAFAKLTLNGRRAMGARGTWSP
jgi:hypothetical protein